jgi:hypothetical protein
VIPVDFVRPHLTRGSIGTVERHYRRADTEAAFSEVYGVPALSADRIGRHPSEKRRAHTALKNEVLDEAAHFIVCQSGDQCGALAEAPPEPARDVVLPPSFPSAEAAGGAHTGISGVQPKQYFAKRHQVKRATIRWPQSKQ